MFDDNGLSLFPWLPFNSVCVPREDNQDYSFIMKGHKFAIRNAVSS